MKKPIINIEDVTLYPRPPAFAAKGAAAEIFDGKMGPIGSILGAQKLGYNITEVPPGKRAFPFHNHRVNEEMFFILQGHAEVRIGTETFSIRKGDIIACPPGSAASAHQIINTGSEALRYLAVSTKISPEIAEYPDSGKFGILGEFQSSDGQSESYMYVGKKSESMDYWEGQK